MAQTSVEWLVEKLYNANADSVEFTYIEIIEQVKEMHKEEILETYKHGVRPYFFGKWNAEEYYNQTFNK
jgi:hypothetical protein